jgi:hypothetical protein
MQGLFFESFLRVANANSFANAALTSLFDAHAIRRRAQRSFQITVHVILEAAYYVRSKETWNPVSVKGGLHEHTINKNTLG